MRTFIFIEGGDCCEAVWCQERYYFTDEKDNSHAQHEQTTTTMSWRAGYCNTVIPAAYYRRYRRCWRRGDLLLARVYKLGAGLDREHSARAFKGFNRQTDSDDSWRIHHSSIKSKLWTRPKENTGKVLWDFEVWFKPVSMTMSVSWCSIDSSPA